MEKECSSYQSRNSANTRAKATRSARIIAIIGSTKCGKTSLVKRFLNDEYTDGCYSPTVEECFNKSYKYRGYILNLDIIDMCEPFMFPAMRDFNVKKAHIILLLYEVGKRDSVHQAVLAFEKIYTLRPQGLSIVLVGTKFDTYPVTMSTEEYELTDELFKILPTVNGGHVLTSAKLGIGVKDAFDYGLEGLVKNIYPGILQVYKDEGEEKCRIL